MGKFKIIDNTIIDKNNKVIAQLEFKKEIYFRLLDPTGTSADDKMDIIELLRNIPNPRGKL